MSDAPPSLTAQLAQISERLERIETRLSTQSAAPERPEQPLTLKEFTDRVGMTRKTISRRIKSREIESLCGRIPSTQLRRFGL